MSALSGEHEPVDLEATREGLMRVLRGEATLEEGEMAKGLAHIYGANLLFARPDQGSER